MMFKFLFAVFLGAIPAMTAGDEADGPLCGQSVAKDAVYLNPNAGNHERVKNLLSHMCWDEKVAQLGGIGGLLGQNSTYDLEGYRDKAKLHNGTISPGSYLNDAKQAAVVLSDLIVTSKEEHRLGIPYLHIGDAVNGPTLRGTTLFPATLTLGMSWNLPLYKEVVKVIRDELHAIGITWALSPEVDVARDPRNGRIGEMYGEDPWMNGEYATAYVATSQERDSNGYMKVAATVKHWLYGTSTGGVNQASMLGGPNHIYNILALPYINLLRKAKPASIMPSYSTIDGVPAHQSSYLLQEILRRQFGFNGIIVSDADAIGMLYATHKTAKDLNDAGIKSLAAGVELELAIGFPTGFETLIGNQTVPGVARDVNRAVERILDLKFQLGLFDRSLEANKTTLDRVLRSEKHLKVNEDITRESIVLLKNDGLLPLSDVKKVAVLGPLADAITTGTYAAWTNRENNNSTFLDAAKKRFGEENINYVRGVDITDVNNADIDSAVAAAKDAGLAIVVLGSIAVGYEDSLFGKRTDGEGNTHASLRFPGRQQDLLDAVIASGVPTVLIANGGQAFELHGNTQKAGAILHGFLGGEKTGEALIDIITGETNPSGRLTITFPATSEVSPVYYNRELSDWQGPGAIQFPYLEHNYIYPFGYGLSYTSFDITEAKTDKTVYGKRDTMKVSVIVSNTGSVDGKEVVQVYLKQRVSPLSQPVKRLIGFSKVDVAAGSFKQVSIEVPIQDLGYWFDTKYKVDAGAYQFLVGSSSADDDLSSPINFEIR